MRCKCIYSSGSDNYWFRYSNTVAHVSAGNEYHLKLKFVKTLINKELVLTKINFILYFSTNLTKA